jgi:uncharacterized protein YkwD
MYVPIGMRIHGCVRHGRRRARRCRSATALPRGRAVTAVAWRTHVAVVVSIAAIAGCGQASDPSQANASDAAPGSGIAPEVAQPSSDSESEQQDADGEATLHARRGLASSSAIPSGSGDDASSAGGSAHDPSLLALGTDAPAPTPSAAGQPLDASASPRTADQPAAGTDRDDALDQLEVSLDALERTVVTLLAAARQETGAPPLQLDTTLLAAARERACTMASGATPLLAEDDTENIGLVIELEPDAAAEAMHEWWMQSTEARDIRLGSAFTRYGVGACTSGERVYYSERFSS